MEITAKDLIRDLQLCGPDLPVYFGGLDFYRVKDRGGVIQIEFNQIVYPDEYSLVHVENQTIKYITAVDRNGKKEKFVVRDEDREMTDDCALDGTVFTIFKKEKPALGFTFEIVIQGEQLYIKYVGNNDHPGLKDKGIVKAMLTALSLFYKRDIYSSTNIDSCKIYVSEGLVPAMKKAWEKYLEELENVEYLPASGRYVFKYRCN